MPLARLGEHPSLASSPPRSRQRSSTTRLRSPVGQFYRRNTATCGCPDHLHRRGRCLHMWALTILIGMSVAARYERLSREFEPIPYVLTGVGEAALDAEATTPVA